MPAARESRMQPDIDDRDGLLFGKNARSHGQHVEVIVLPRHPRLVFAGDVGGADARSLVGGYRHANAAATDENAALRLARGNAAGDRVRKIRVVAGVAGDRAAVVDSMAQILKVKLESFLSVHNRRDRHPPRFA